MTAENKSIWTAMPSETAEFEHLEAGAYNGVCCGVTAREFTDYNDKSKKVTKAQFIFQISEGQGGQCQYLRTRPFTIVLNEKSNLYTFINTWTGATLERMTKGFDCSKMVGFPAQVIVTETTGKDGKVYAEIANVLKAKKGQKVPVVPDAIPAYLTRGCVEFLLAEGLTVKEDKPLVKAATFPAAAPSGLGPNDRIDDRAPGLIVPGAAPAQAIPAGAKVTQAADAQAWIQNPPAQPADAVPNVGATAPEEDDDSDLPF